MQATEYFNNMLGKLTKAVEEGVSEQIKNESFWKNDRKYCIGNLSYDSFMVRQSRELRDLGGVLKNKGTIYATWYPPKGARLYQLYFFGSNRKHGIYYLLFLKDGRNYILKLTEKSIRTVDHLFPYAYRQLMIEMFLELFRENGRIKKVIKRLSRTGGYK